MLIDDDPLLKESINAIQNVNRCDQADEKEDDEINIDALNDSEEIIIH